MMSRSRRAYSERSRVEVLLGVRRKCRDTSSMMMIAVNGRVDFRGLMDNRIANATWSVSCGRYSVPREQPTIDQGPEDVHNLGAQVGKPHERLDQGQWRPDIGRCESFRQQKVLHRRRGLHRRGRGEEWVKGLMRLMRQRDVVVPQVVGSTWRRARS
jgi:hypothetical protein